LKMRRKILFDARMFGLEHAGIGRYVTNLLSEIKEQAPPDWEFFLLVRKEKERKVREKLGNFYHYLPVNSSHYSLGEQWELPWVIKKGGFDLVHFPHFNLPAFSPTPYVVTIHDLIKHFFRGKKTTTKPGVLYWPKYFAYRILVRRVIRKAEQIIVPSNWWKKKLTTLFPAAKGRITVTWEGVDERFQTELPSKQEVQKTLSLFGLKKYRFFVYTGSVYPHKNVERLIEAFSLLKRKDIVLAIVCARNVFLHRLEEIVKKAKMEKRVVFLGFVSDRQLVALYRGAIALVQPSLMEGFGLTGLEAMAVGLPVISSSASCLPEIYGKAALYFNPYSPRAIKEALETILTHPEKRRQLIALGRKRVKVFSWKKTAQKTLNVYQKALENGEKRG